ncbi:uncharacterized protein LOC133189602 [Saccostrea echinata]|uniref:uncharacterized protein LOC133189602 n=1 Tax=Saccostrea echinata TaxID=191078 RepID=UPI002A828B92|nr:uncharacterized protein LOC133189602 [Saccostrea echinata]
MSKFFRLFRGVTVKDVGNQAILADYGQMLNCLLEMSKSNNALQNLYQSLRKNIMYSKEKLQYSEDLMEMIADKFEGMDELLGRVSEILRVEEDVMRQKKELLRKMREDVADSKFRLLSMKKPELEKYMKLAEDQAVPSISGFVREEREQLEQRLVSAKIAVNDYIERNFDDQEAYTDIQLYREFLQQEHNNHMLVILNEFGSLKKKRTFLLRNPVFNDNEGKKDLLHLFRVPQEELEATQKECTSMGQMKEALTERIREQRLTKSAIADSNQEILKKLLNEKDTVMKLNIPYKVNQQQEVGLNVIMSI